MAIKRLVFEEGKLSLGHLKEALDANFGVSGGIEKPDTTATESAPKQDATYELVLEAVKKVLGKTAHLHSPHLITTRQSLSKGLMPG